MEVDFSGDYLNADNCHNGDIIEIVGEGEYKDIEWQGKKKKVFNMPVKVGEKKLTYTPNQKAGKLLVDAWGKDSKAWIGRKMLARIVTVEIAGNESQQIRITPIKDEKI